MHGLRHRLTRAGGVWVGVFALSAAFTTYFTMYAFRRPFAVGTYEDVAGWSSAVDFKVAIVIAQVLGYALSKLAGVKFVSEARPALRPWMIMGFILVSWLALVAFAVVPAPWKILAIFCNGLPLGMIWGLVFSYLEGRRITDILGAALCVSFIVSSGVVRSVGSALIVTYGVPELWMPAATGAMFLPVLALAVFFLAQTPLPDEADKAERMVRTPMFAAERRAFFRANAVGLTLLVVAYVVLTALRDFRENFAAEIWAALGYGDTPAVYAVSELPVALAVLLIMGATVVIRSNLRAVLVHHGIIAAGAVLLILATLAFEAQWLGPLTWMILIGTGIYMGYIPYNSILADRLPPALGQAGNAAFFMYLADAAGYLGSVSLLLYRNFGATELSWLNFFTAACYTGGTAIIALVATSAVSFHRRAKAHAIAPVGPADPALT